MPSLRSKSGKLIAKDRDKAELLNSQFKQKLTKISNEDFTYIIPSFHRSWPQIPDITVSEHGVLQLLNNLKTSKAAGLDGIYPQILKEAALEIALVLKCLFQKSLDTGPFPED